MTNFEVCAGCRVIEECYLKPFNKKNDTCPCSLCLIKGVCLDPCDKYVKYRKIERQIKYDEIW